MFDRKGHIAAITLAAMLILTACGGKTPTETPIPPTEITVQFSWVHSIEFAGFYTAAAHHYYTDANLDVHLESGGFTADGEYIDPIEHVVNGEADFGIAGADAILTARAEGLSVVAVAVIYQRNPVVLLSLAEKEITRPQDLIGRRICVEEGSTIDISYRALMNSEEIDRSEVEEVSKTDFTLAPLLNDEVDVFPGFITNEPVQAQLLGIDVNLILMSDYGIDIYSNVIFTTEELIENRPHLVGTFVRTTLEGTRDAIKAPEEAAQRVLDLYGDTMTAEMREAQTPGMIASIPLLNQVGSHPGMMTDEAWEMAHQILLNQGVLQEAIDFEAAYTLEFLGRIYGE